MLIEAPISPQFFIKILIQSRDPRKKLSKRSNKLYFSINSHTIKERESLNKHKIECKCEILLVMRSVVTNEHKEVNQHH